MAVRETPPNWLSEIIGIERDKHRLLAFRTVNKIVEAIANHPKGNAIKDRPDLKDAIREGLHAADERQHELESDPDIMTASPSHEAASVIAKRLGISLD